MKIARIVTIPEAFSHISGHFNVFKKQKIETILISSRGEYAEFLSKENGIKHIVINIERNPSLVKDVVSLIKLYFHFRKSNYDVVHSSTPKAGLLVSIAAFFACVPVRLHTFTGQRWATLNGVGKFILKKMDTLISILNTQCFADSESQIQFLITEKVISSNRIRCIGAGSYGGLNVKRFNIQNRNKYINDVREELGIKNEDFVFGFVGRINKDKGIEELIESFLMTLLSTEKNCYLVILGTIELGANAISSKYLKLLESHPQIKYLGYCNTPEKFMSCFDVFCLPSYREGFGTVVLEAAGLGIPTIASRIPGLIDAVKDGQTGKLVEVKSTDDLSRAMIGLSGDLSKVKQMGNAANERANELFNSDLIASLTCDIYRFYLKK